MTMNGMDAGGAQGQTPGGNMGEGDPGMPCSSLLMLRRGPLHRLRQLLVIQNSFRIHRRMFSWSTLQAAEGAKNKKRTRNDPLKSPSTVTYKWLSKKEECHER
jgi:hypothetical protein